MDTLQHLTLKTANAMGRLADLERRAEHAAVEADMVVRPRERRPRRLRLLGSRLVHDGRCVWFLLEPAVASAPAE